MPRIGSHSIGEIPLVVGVASQADTLAHLSASPPPVCDVLEIRADLIGEAADAWLRNEGSALRAHVPILLTVRAANEGGQWTGTPEARVARCAALLPFVDAVDVELRAPEAESIVRAARAAGRCALASFHDFASTPDAPALSALLAQGAATGADIVKFATWTRTDEDLGRLEALLRLEDRPPLSLLGMGPMGAASRVRLAMAGSCLTYGFLDAVSAPGQLSSAELVERLEAHLPAYRAARRARG